MDAAGNRGIAEMTLEQRAQAGPGADLVLEGGGVKGIGLAGAVMTLHQAGYVFPRVGGTSAGAIVAALIAAYQARGVDLSQLVTDMQEMDYTKFEQKSWAEKHLGLLGDAGALIAHQGVYASDYVAEWLTSKLQPLNIRTFADLKITGDDADGASPGTSLAPYQRYRLVTHTSDLTRGALVRLPWDLPYYLLDSKDRADMATWIEVIDDYLIVDAVRASMSIPYFFRPFEQKTPLGACTWVDGGVLQNFPVTVFDRTDGHPNRWPTFGIKLSAKPQADTPDKPVTGNITEGFAIAHTALSEWNRYPLADEGVGARTVYVDTMNISSTDFGLTTQQRDHLYANGQAAATRFLAAWNATRQPQPAPADPGPAAPRAAAPRAAAPRAAGAGAAAEAAVGAAASEVVAEAIEVTAAAAADEPGPATAGEAAP
jgi:NTE family protein